MLYRRLQPEVGEKFGLCALPSPKHSSHATTLSTILPQSKIRFLNHVIHQIFDLSFDSSFEAALAAK